MFEIILKETTIKHTKQTRYFFQNGIKTKKFFRAKRTLCAKNIEINLFTVL